MWKYLALISYVGTEYCGWQKQKDASSNGKTSIQKTIETALEQMTQEQVSVVGSGRTDSGVHALGQVAHFVLRKKEWVPRIVHQGLNGILPMNIRIRAVQRVPIEFHAQRSAIQKQYSYYFQQGPCPLPHLEPLSWWIRKELDVEAMSAALQSLLGEHDFKPFRAAGAKPGPTQRKMMEATAVLEPISFPGLGIFDPPPKGEGPPLGLVRVRLIGSGFLKQMVRGIAGTLLQVGEGRRSPSCIQEILESGDRSSVGPTAPARALWLEKVWYSSSLVQGVDGLLTF